MIIASPKSSALNMMVKFFKDCSIPILFYRFSQEVFYTGQTSLRCLIVILNKNEDMSVVADSINTVISASPSDAYQKIVFVNMDATIENLFKLGIMVEAIDDGLLQEVFKNGDSFSPKYSNKSWRFDDLFHFIAENAVTKLVVPDYQYVDDEYWILDHTKLSEGEKKTLMNASRFQGNRFFAWSVQAVKEFFTSLAINVNRLTDDHAKTNRSFIINPKNILGDLSISALSLRHIIEVMNNIGKDHNDLYEIDNKVKKSRKIVFYAVNTVGMGHASRVSKIVHYLLKQEKDIRIHVICHVGCESLFEGMNIQLIIMPPNSPAFNYAGITEMHRIFTQELRDASVFIFDGVNPHFYITDAMAALFEGQSIWLRRGLASRGAKTKDAFSRECFFDHIVCPLEIFPELNSRDIVHHITPDIVGPVYDDPDKPLSDDIKTPKYDIVVDLGGLDTSLCKDPIDAILYFSLMYPDVKILFLSWPYSDISNVISTREDKSKNVDVNFIPNAISIIRKSRLFIGMSEYNSFTDVIANRVPSIFYFVEDKDTADKDIEDKDVDMQSRRVRIAAQYGMALLGEWSIFGLIQQMETMLNNAFYDNMHDKLKALSLPKPGQAEISKKIIACMEGK